MRFKPGRKRKMSKHSKYDDTTVKDTYTPDGNFIILEEQNIYINHTSNMDFEILNQRHNSVEIIFAEEGEAEYKIGDTVYSVGKNDILIIGAMDLHFRKITKVPFSRYGLTMTGTFMRTIPEIYSYLDIYNTLSPEKSKLLKNLPQEEFSEYIHILLELRKETADMQADSQEMIKAYIQLLTLKLKRNLHYEKRIISNLNLYHTMLEIKNYIDLNYKNDLSLENLSTLFYFQPNTISKNFKTAFNTNINKYINTVRVSNAVRLLEKSSISIEELAYEVGYKNINTFLRQFNEMMQTSPLQYRKKFLDYMKNRRVENLS